MSTLPRIDLTRRESQIMEILYRRRRATVEDIRAELPDASSPSSVRKLLDIMIERGLLGREYDGPRYVYYPAAKVEDASRSALQQLVRTFFDNSPGSAMAALLDLSETTLSDSRTPPAGPAARARTRAGRQAMNAFADGASMPLLTLALKASALLGVTALTMLLIGRRASAATRHWAWSLAVVSLLGLPVLSLSLPAWSVAVPVAATVAPAVSTNAAPVGNDDASVPPLAESSAAASVMAVSPGEPRATGPSWSAMALMLYAAGVAAMVARLVVQQLAARRLVGRAVEIRDADWMALLSECAAHLGISRRGPTAAKPRASDAHGHRRPRGRDPDSVHRRHLDDRAAPRRVAARAGARRSPRLPDAAARRDGVCECTGHIRRCGGLRDGFVLNASSPVTTACCARGPKRATMPDTCWRSPTTLAASVRLRWR